MSKLFAVLLCLLFAGCAANNQTHLNTNPTNQNAAISSETAKQPDRPKFNPAQAVSFSLAKPVEIKAGGQFEAEINIKVLDPYHVNSNPPSEKGFIPLEINLENGGGITIGKPVYPKGELKKFTFSADKPLSVYTGEVLVRLPLKVDKTVAAGQQQLIGKLKFQPCDDEVCYRPQTLEMTLPVTIN
jgi:hypothetical protein